jgi:2-keto-4-pentenoate hydratase/2-oxohepta-3-ene-1,7-dioic acid hydratase in catechol pathway
MKLVTFETAGGARRVGAVVGDHNERVIDLTAAASATPQAALFADMLSLIDGGESALDQARGLIRAARQTLAVPEVRLLSPIPVPRRLRDFLSFELHVRQSRANRHLFGIETEPWDPAKIQIPKVWYERPIYYKSNCFSVVGPEADIHWPSYSVTVDYELEVALVVGRQGKNLTLDTAPQHVFGYCIFNDFSARDVQYTEMPGSLGPSKGKDFDTGNALGPWIATADEVDPQNLTMIARVNGEEWSRGHSSTMHHPFAKLLAYASLEETVYPGEVLGSGTVGGGCGNELGRFMKHGDVIELEVSGLGVLRNRIVAPHVPRPPSFPIRIS